VIISAISNDGKILDSYETAVRITELPPAQPEQTNELSGLNIVYSITVFLAAVLLFSIKRG
jgi:hypothetical protein